MEKEIIILAKSTKHQEYCIAGIDTSTGEWIRPISDNMENEGSVPLEDITYEDGTELQIFDKVKIKLLSHNPTKAQPENFMYDPSVYWEKTGKSTLNELITKRGFDNPYKIFYNNDKEVLEKEIGGQPSLLFVNVKKAVIFIKTFDDGDRKVQLNFEYNGISYRYFKISDRVIKKSLEDFCDGSYPFHNDLQVVFSLTNKYDRTGKYYKMAAQILQLN